MKSMKKLLGILLTGVMVFSLTACGGTKDSTTTTKVDNDAKSTAGVVQGVEAMKLTLSEHVSENDSNNVYAVAFAKAVNDLSGGKMKVEIYANGQLFGQADALAALKQGTLDIALSDTALFANYNPAGALFDMPYLIDSREQAIKMVKDDEIINKLRDIMIKSANIRVLTVQPLYFRSSLVKDMKVNSIAGFKGLIMRTPEAPHTIAAFKAFAANPTVIPSGEAYTAVQTGVADGLEGHPEYMFLQKFYEVAKNYVQTKHVFTFTAFSMSGTVYDKMSAPQKEVIDKAAVVAQNAFLDYTSTLFEDSIVKLKEKGVKITEVDLAPFKASTVDYVSKFVEKNNLQEIYDKINKLK